MTQVTAGYAVLSSTERGEDLGNRGHNEMSRAMSVEVAE